MRQKKDYIRLSLLFFLLGGTSLIQANPETPTLIEGDVGFSQPDAYTLTVSSSSSRSIIDWDEFSINTNETTNFNLPSSSSAILNRVTSSNVSNILGTIQSNGQVFIVNPNGILIGPNAVVTASAFLASTLDVDNTEFMNNSDMTFTCPENSDVFLVNYGTLTATDGDVVLLSYQIVNAGNITSENGVVAQGTGIEIVLQPNSTDNRISIIPHSYMSTVPIGLEDSTYIQALHAELQADGNAYQLAIKHEGWIDAQGLPGVGAAVFCNAVEGSIFENGTITSLNDDADIGGQIVVTGAEVELGNSCTLYASGLYGGGTVYVGGGFGGNDPDIPNATNTVFQTNAQVSCDAILSGDGGTVVVWADNNADFLGTIVARGGSVDGNGGVVEVSGVNYLNFMGTVDVHADNGSDGLLILDPMHLNYLPAMRDGFIQAEPNFK